MACGFGKDNLGKLVSRLGQIQRVGSAFLLAIYLAQQ